jgi:hypothetical protein
VHAPHAVAQSVEALGSQIGGQPPALARIAPAEGLPREPVLVDREVAGEPFHPVPDQRGEIAAGVGLQGVELGRRYAQPEISGRHVRQFAHEPAVEHRRELVLEQLPLLGQVAGVEQPLRPLAVQTADHMPELDGPAEQAVTVDVAAEHGDPAAPCEITAVPIGAHGWLELGRDEAVGGQVAHHVAAAGGDRDQSGGRPQLQGRHVDLGILPDLGIDQSLEHSGEHALEDATLGGWPRLQGGVPDERVGQWALPLRGSD